MNDINRVTITGTVSRAAQLSATNSGFQLAKFSIRTARSFKGRDGMNKDKASYFDCAVVGTQAERAARQLPKDARVLLDGTLVQDSWKDQRTGEWQHAVRIEAWDFLALPPEAPSGEASFTAAPPQAGGYGQPAPSPAYGAPPPMRQGTMPFMRQPGLSPAQRPPEPAASADDVDIPF